MNPKVEEARALLKRAQADYRTRLKQVDTMLKVVAAQDPTDIDAALEVQNAYGAVEFDKARLAPLEQPASAVVESVVEAVKAPVQSVLDTVLHRKKSKKAEDE